MVTTSFGSAAPRVFAPLVVDVDPRQAVFAGALTASVTRPADRIQIVLEDARQTNGGARSEDSGALTTLVHNALPHAIVEPLPAPTPWGGLAVVAGQSSGPRVRILMSIPSTNSALRDSVSRILTEANVHGSPGTRIVSIDHVYAGCAPFDAALRNAAQVRVAELARMLGTSFATGPTLQVVPAPRPFEAAPEGMAHCARDFAIFPDASLPSNVSIASRRAFTFAQPITFALDASARQTHEVRALQGVEGFGPRLHLHAPSVLLTVEGSADLERRTAGTLYVYEGPNGRWFPSDITLASLDVIRRRVRASGVADNDITTQLNPADGRWYVRVRSPDVRRNDTIVTAIGGSVANERRAVQTTTFGNTCADERLTLVRAVADARARASRIAIGLGTSIDRQPIAVESNFGNVFEACIDRGNEYSPPTPIAQHISGQLVAGKVQSDDNISAFATFRIGQPQLSGAVRAAIASDDPMSLTARFGYVAPPIVYPEAAYEGTAQLETRLHPQRVRVDMLLSPDNRHGFHAIDRGLAAHLAAMLGVSAAQYTAAFVPDLNGGSTPTPDQMIFQAELGNRGAVTEHALNEAQMTALSAGSGGFLIVPQSDRCVAVDDALAVDTIRAAAQKLASSERAGRVIAIDLRGPFSADGICGQTNSYNAEYAIRNAPVKDVRIAAYARVFYGH